MTAAALRTIRLERMTGKGCQTGPCPGTRRMTEMGREETTGALRTVESAAVAGSSPHSQPPRRSAMYRETAISIRQPSLKGLRKSLATR